MSLVVSFMVTKIRKQLSIYQQVNIYVSLTWNWSLGKANLRWKEFTVVVAAAVGDCVCSFTGRDMRELLGYNNVLYLGRCLGYKDIKIHPVIQWRAAYLFYSVNII